MSKPLIFLTDFLGAGKTNLLLTLLLHLRTLGRRADVILNDFANAEFDAATLGEGVASLSPIAASCACFESLDELMELCIGPRLDPGALRELATRHFGPAALN